MINSLINTKKYPKSARLSPAAFQHVWLWVTEGNFYVIIQNVGISKKSVLACCNVYEMLIMIFTEPRQIGLPIAPGAPFTPWCHSRATLLLLMPTRSFCSETHQSARCLIGSERLESIAICTPAPKSSLWTCHSRRITCSRLVLHLTKGSPISTRDNNTHNIPILSSKTSPKQAVHSYYSE